MIWLLLLTSCRQTVEDTATPGTDLGPPPMDPAIVALVDPHRMKAHIDVLADDALGGRIPGSVGSQSARDYILGEMLEIGLEPIGIDGGFEYSYPNSAGADNFMLDPEGLVVPHQTTEGVNLVGVIPGTEAERADEYMVVMAHYDHLGVDASGDAYNGAFDNAAAVAMNLEIARVLIEQSAAFPRSLVFLFTDDEEFGLDGADEWIRDPTVPQEDIVFGVSTDPLGRASLPDFDPIALMGLERSPGLDAAGRSAARFTQGPVYFISRDIIPVFASDQDTFYDQSTPALWFTNIGFSFYHTVDDTAETIDYRIMLRNAELLMYALATIGTTADRYEYTGPKPTGADEALEAKRVFEDLLKSDYVSGSDAELARFYIAELDKVIAADSEEAVDNAEILYVAALYFLLFDLPTKFPGEIPPPWPEGW